MSDTHSQTIHATAVASEGRGILLAGPSGSGKSDLALRLIDRGARLVSDDYSNLRSRGGVLRVSAPETIRGKMEVRGLGLLEMDPQDDIPVCLFVRLDGAIERLPEGKETVLLLEKSVPVFAVAAFEASAPLKVELALDRFGLRIE